MTWANALAYARMRSYQTGDRWYVRGFMRTITHEGEWLYGAYQNRNQELNRRNRPYQWWIDDKKGTRA